MPFMPVSHVKPADIPYGDFAPGEPEEP